jgi:uncharacterized membrane protein
LSDYARRSRDERWVRRGTAFGSLLGVIGLVTLALVRAIFST